MKNHSFKRVISAVLTGLIILSLTTFVFAAEPAKVDFNITETSEDIVELKLSVKNATFAAILASIRYNPEAIQPVETTDSANKFATFNEEADFFGTMNLSADSSKGYFGFAIYIKPGTTAEGINDKKEFVTDDTGIDLYTFRFRKISDKSFDFEIATKDETKPYQSSIPEGIQILNYSGPLDVNVTFDYGDQEPTSTLIKPTVRVPESDQITSAERKQDVICLQIGKSLSISKGKKVLIDPDDTSVVPYISNDRTMVPLRFVAENLGAEVLWEEGWNGCIIKKDSNEIQLTFNSAEFKVNGEKVVYDAPIEITSNRTMVPVRFVSEQLGCNIYWNELNKAVVISPKDNPWVENRKAEITALNEMLITLLGII